MSRLNVETELESDNEREFGNDVSREKINRREFVADDCDRKRPDREASDSSESEKLFELGFLNLKLTKLFLKLVVSLTNR